MAHLFLCLIQGELPVFGSLTVCAHVHNIAVRYHRYFVRVWAFVGAP